MNEETVLELIKNNSYEYLTEEMFYMLERTLSTEDILKYQMLVNSRIKSATVAWVLWALIGTLGGNLIYLGLSGSRLVAFILLIVGWITYYFLIGIFIVFGVWIWSGYLTYTGLKQNKIQVKSEVYKELFIM